MIFRVIATGALLQVCASAPSEHVHLELKADGGMRVGVGDHLMRRATKGAGAALAEVKQHAPDAEPEAQALEEATAVAVEIPNNVSAKPFAGNSSEADPQSSEIVEALEDLNASHMQGPAAPAGQPAVVMAGIYGRNGDRGGRGPTGPPGGPGPEGPTGASIIGHTGIMGIGGLTGKKGKTGQTGARGLPGTPGQPGSPPPDFQKWHRLLQYYEHVVGKMETAATKNVRVYNRDVSMMQQQSALYKARTFALNNGSQELHHKMVDSYKRMVKSVSSAQEVDDYLARMSMATPLDSLHDAQRLYPAYLGTQRASLAMQSVQYQHSYQQPRQTKKSSTTRSAACRWLLVLLPPAFLIGFLA
ncbi:unnamed protein product [Effrenium voratum]|nr:unnamed protein product [Effrenium voratum]|mmetsp:Transcript_58808/g.140021  ORF Transcript_58808/g.140021 Transcript_58808/m.140021 type:complete len:359 (+) Transcript_58808:89-1165(+)